MLGLLKRLNQSFLEVRSEDAFILRTLSRVDSSRQAQILEVGCGLGRLLRKVLAQGHRVRGVDANRSLIQAHQAKGLPCLQLDDLDTEKGVPENSLDVLVIAHVIEHLAPNDLLGFLENYLKRLKPGGILIVATPLLTANFFDDFDHVKPYQPESLNLIFQNTTENQFQFSFPVSMQLEDLWFRRIPYRLKFYRSNFLPQSFRWLFPVNFALGFFYALSGGFIGQKDAWTGVYRKQHPATQGKH
ncbi:MAG: methyltransferase [Bdellovibrionales bacterium]|nr:methyltransferase [Bdellovibrionales bacterium]